MSGITFNIYPIERRRRYVLCYEAILPEDRMIVGIHNANSDTPVTGRTTIHNVCDSLDLHLVVQTDALPVGRSFVEKVEGAIIIDIEEPCDQEYPPYPTIRITFENGLTQGSFEGGETTVIFYSGGGSAHYPDWV